MIDNLKSLYIFAKTVEMGSFRAVARAHNLSPSVVSYHISQLEKNLAVSLMYRSTRKLSLTADGRKLFNSVHSLLEGVEKGIDSLTSHSVQPVGALRITGSLGFSRGHVTKVIADFAKLYPKVQITVDYSDEYKDLIENGIDLAIRPGPLQDSSLIAKKLVTYEKKLVTSPEYLETKKMPEIPEELCNWDWIWFNITPRFRVFRNQQGIRKKVSFSPRIEVNNGNAMCQLVADGLGIATPPTYLIETEIREGTLVEILEEWKVEPFEIYVVWPPNSTKGGLTQRFVNFLVNSL